MYEIRFSHSQNAKNYCMSNALFSFIILTIMIYTITIRSETLFYLGMKELLLINHEKMTEFLLEIDYVKMQRD